jgi:prepilin-type N-terminal cleavage/methylation domain-containing protein
MIRRSSGFTLVELIISMLMSGLIITAASSAFIGLYRQARTQASIVESNENLIGLDMLRRDIERAGYGLTWDDPITAVTYAESNANRFGLDNAPHGGLRAIASQDDVVTYTSPNDIFNHSDYLVIRALNVARTDACERWSYVRSANVVNQWNSPNINENFQNGDRVIVLDPKSATMRPLISSGSFYTTYNAGALADSSMAPTDPNDTYLVYGISGTVNPARPFNRVDYYIARTATTPSRCAPNTGVLLQATLKADGEFEAQPVIDCVADMQVIFGLDNDGNGTFQNGVGAPVADGYSTTLAGLLPPVAQQTRTRVKEVRVYILTHEGGRDLNFTYPSNVIAVGDSLLGAPAHDFALGTNLNYRWKVYTLVVKPFNLSN